MVPGSTLMYGSSFWMETSTPRLLSTRPIDAAVIPLPTDETTPPVRNMYFGIALPSHLPRGHSRARPLGIQHHEPCFARQRAFRHSKLGLGNNVLRSHLTAKMFDRFEIRHHGSVQAVVHGYDKRRVELCHKACCLSRPYRLPASHRNEKDVDAAQFLDLLVCELVVQIAQMAHS